MLPPAKYVGGKVVYNADGTAQTVAAEHKSSGCPNLVHRSLQRPRCTNVLDASYIKLREVTISYTIPGRLTGPVKNLKVGIFGETLPHLEPQWLELIRSQTTSFRQYPGNRRCRAAFSKNVRI